MNDEQAVAYGSRPFAIDDIGFGSIPGQSSLFLDHTYCPEAVSEYYPNRSVSLRDFAVEMLGSYRTDRNELCAALRAQNASWGAGRVTFENIERLASPDAVAVLTGQQAGLFTGPAYTIYKAVSAILLAEELTASGIDAVPVFWIASEDHDIDEVRRTFGVDTAGSLREFAYEAEAAEYLPVGYVGLGEKIGRFLKEFTSSLSQSDHSSTVLRILESGYTTGETFSSAFAKVMTALTRERGLVFVSPLDPEIRKLALPVTEKAVSAAREIGSALRRRDSELVAGGYHTQVLVGEDFFPFFLIDDQKRRVALRLDPGSGRVKLQNGETSFTIEALLSDLNTEPGILSPNALMRPVIQDCLFPTVCYIGGSAEIAYFAQNSAIYELLERPVTPVRHRASFTVIEPRNRRTLGNYGLSFKDVLRGRDEIASLVTERFLDPGTARLFDETEEGITELLDRLHASLLRSEPSLAESLSKRRLKMMWHLETLRRKFRSAEGFKDKTVARRLDHLFSTLLPNGSLQERSVNIFYFIDQYGPEFIEWIFGAADTGQKDHRLLSL